MENRKIIDKISEIKSWFSEKNINEIKKPLAQLIKMKRVKISITKIRNEIDGNTADPAAIEQITREWSENFMLINLKTWQK